MALKQDKEPSIELFIKVGAFYFISKSLTCSRVIEVILELTLFY